MRPDAPGNRRGAPYITARPVRVPSDTVLLDADLVVPESAQGVILFAHGSGSSRHSSRNRFVAEVLQNAGFATLLLDLLTPEEEAVDRTSGHLRFDIRLLACRLVFAAEWLHTEDATQHLPIGCFGASTGGGAALVAAATRQDLVRTVVSRGGRPDLAGDALLNVQAPTLLIVGGSDGPVIGMNREGLTQLLSAGIEARMEIIQGATHLFEEPGALEEVARLAMLWFALHLASATSPAAGDA